MSKVTEAYMKLMKFYNELADQGVEIDLSTPGKKGCTKKEIQELESKLGYSIGSELRDFLTFSYPQESTHCIWLGGSFFEKDEEEESDEQDPGWETYLNTCIDGIITAYKEGLELAEEYKSDDSMGVEDIRLKHSDMNKMWIPIGYDSLGQHGYFIDMDPSSVGKVGQIISGAGESSPSYVIADTLAEFFSVVLKCHKDKVEWSDILSDQFENSNFNKFNLENGVENTDEVEEESSIEEISPNYQEEDDRELAMDLGLSFDEFCKLRKCQEFNGIHISLDNLGEMAIKMNLPDDPETGYIGLTFINDTFFSDTNDSIKEYSNDKEMLDTVCKIVEKVFPLLNSNHNNVKFVAELIISDCFKFLFVGGRVNEAYRLIPYAKKSDKRFAINKINKMMSNPLIKLAYNQELRSKFMEKLES
ncbi:SMI1/KNR4 family protein [Spartinivicinus poritis]|uniref:SMI1/KNR4 family protein n=1 Tax=Spartinivicinus poritis TaxID=2994640 RepID=A0ABT5UH99_9GAMM|nr:SMI1/KNR4 family protein [Spartinivicinus sp. A2-2]MDE1465774.1 SMI1/KNR4 family protein [Spartinivicinus sp. A2-2]